MVQRDLDAAGIPSQDVAGRSFDFHSLRCELARLADAAGVTPRVVQRLMRHSKLEMTGRYTRPRAVDIAAAASLLPSLKPEGEQPEALAATGTDDRLAHRHASDPTDPAAPDPENSGVKGSSISKRFAHHLPTAGDASGCFVRLPDGMAGSNDPTSMKPNPPENKALEASRGSLMLGEATDRGGTRTLDQRINLPHRLSPTATSVSAPPGMAGRGRACGLSVWTIPSPSQACRV